MPVTDPLTQQLLTPARAVVLRRFNGARPLLRGELVDTSDWLQANVARQIDRRYLAPLPYGFDEKSAVTVETDGVKRVFMNQDAADEAKAIIASLVSKPVVTPEPQAKVVAAEPTEEASSASKEDAPEPQAELPKTQAKGRASK